MQVDNEKIDEAILALLYLTLHDRARAWKSFDWDAMNRLYEKGLHLRSGRKSKVRRTDRKGAQRIGASVRKALLKRVGCSCGEGKRRLLGHSTDQQRGM